MIASPAGGTVGRRSLAEVVAALRLRETAVQLLAFILSLAALIGVLTLLGYPTGKITIALVDGSVGDRIALGITLSEAMPLVLTGTAVWIALQVGLFNIGADGQLRIGGVAALALVLAVPDATPGVILIIVGLAAAAIAGASWSAVAAVLRVYRGANEVISTVMLNFMAFIIVDELMHGALRAPEATHTPRTSEIPRSARLPHLLENTHATIGIVVAVAVSIVAVRLIERSELGLRLRSIGLNRSAAEHAGVRVARYQLWTFLASGAVAGLAGGLVILGFRYKIAPGWAPTWGFLGILIAFLAARNAYMIVIWGVLFGMLAAAGPELKGAASVPDSVVTLMQVLPVIAVFVLYRVGASRPWQIGSKTPVEEGN